MIGQPEIRNGRVDVSYLPGACAFAYMHCTHLTRTYFTQVWYGVILLIRGCVANNVPESLKGGNADFLVQKQIPTSHSQDINYGTSILAQITTSAILILWSRNESPPRIYLLSRNNQGVSILAQNTSTSAILIIHWRSLAVFLKSWVFSTESKMA